MLKKLIIKCSDLINRDDISFILKNVSKIDEIENQNIQSDVIKLIQYYNFTISNIYENFLDACITEEFVSDNNGNILYSNFRYMPAKIIDVYSSNLNLQPVSISPTQIETGYPNTTFKVAYKYLPKQVSDLDDDVVLPLGINEKIIIYGIVSEFMASKDSFEKSEFWKNKFLYEIFKFKIKKERRLKQTFLI